MKAAITHFHSEVNDEAPERPLDFGLIRRLFAYTQPYAAKRNWLLLLVLVRAIQLPFLSWLIGRVVKTIEVAVNTPVATRDLTGTLAWALVFLGMALSTQLSFHFRQRLALELGESVMQDLRRDIFQHLLRMPLSFFNRCELTSFQQQRLQSLVGPMRRLCLARGSFGRQHAAQTRPQRHEVQVAQILHVIRWQVFQSA